MTVLNAQNRARVAAGFQREVTVEPCGFTKPQLAAAVAAADDWVEANTAAFNTALPAGFRSTASITQKIALLCMVLERRAGRLQVSEDGTT